MWEPSATFETAGPLSDLVGITIGAENNHPAGDAPRSGLRFPSFLDELPAEEIGLDLNDEKNLTALDDPTLRSHILQARQSALVEPNVVADRELIRAKDVETRKMLSTIVRVFHELQNAIRTLDENLQLQVRNADKLVRGELPHGFPKDDFMSHLHRKLKEVGAQLVDIPKRCSDIEANVTLARRNYELIFESLTAPPKE